MEFSPYPPFLLLGLGDRKSFEIQTPCDSAITTSQKSQNSS
jgi:hypothetical protein